MVFSEIINKNIVLSRESFPSQYDIAFAPIADDGQVGTLNKYVLEELGYKLPSKFIFSNNDGGINTFRLLQQENLIPVLFIVTVGRLSTTELLSNNLYAALREFRSLLNGKRVWIPLMGTGAGGLTLEQSYNITFSVINNVAHSLNTVFTISIPEGGEGTKLFEKLTQGNRQSDNEDITLFLNEYEGHFYVAGSYWDGEEQMERFFEEGIWETGHETKFAHVIKPISKGDIIFLKSTYQQDGISYLRIKGIGIITNNENDGTLLYVNWTHKRIISNIENLGYLRDSITKLTNLQAAEVIKKIGLNEIKNSILHKILAEQVIASSPKEFSSPGISSDSDKGVDYFDISKDVSAFAKVVAAKSFEPPLAIALFGRWGSGKSFFMRHLKERIQNLSKDKSGFYCQGIAHIHFNAWSYMDANLWASIVSRIFEGLQLYINDDTTAKKFKDEIDRELTKQLSITQEELGKLEREKDSIDEQIKKLNSKKKEAANQIKENIKQIRKTTLKEIISKVDEKFNVKNQIEKSLENNDSYIKTTDDLKKIIPQEYWKDPNELHKQTKSFITFIKAFFRGKWYINLIWLIAITGIIYFTPGLLKLISEKVFNTNFSLPEKAWYYISIGGIILTRITNTYKKLQPLFASFWEIKENYEKERETAIFEYEQQEKALKMQIEQGKNEISAINLQIQNAISIQSKLKFKLENALSTEALYTFIERRCVSEDYQKHLGIVSTIRKDFEILSDLFDEHKTEIVNSEDKRKFLKKFDKPLERIILYIDDLDRCPEERVVEVLEAVNLLMAYPLFIVVVGVDPIWIKNSLIKRYSFQFTSKSEEEIHTRNLISIDPANYLEKIFQIPFRLKDASQQSVKNMIGSLAQQRTINKPNLLIKDDLPDEIEIDAGEIKNIGSENESNPQIQQVQTTSPIQSTSKPEDLILSEAEIKLLQSFAKLIGNNPRAIKRFVNIYRIVKIHEELSSQHNNREEELLAVMFLIALSIGPLKDSYASILAKFERYNQKVPFANILKLSDITDPSATDKETLELKDLLTRHIDNDDDGKILKTIPLGSLFKYIVFINRFSFKSI